MRMLTKPKQTKRKIDSNMTRKMPRTRTRAKALAFTTAAIAISCGIASTSAFSPVLPTSITTKGRSMLMPSSMMIPKRHHPLLQMSKLETEDEKFSAATWAQDERAEMQMDIAEGDGNQGTKSTKNPTPVLVSMLQNLWDRANEDDKLSTNDHQLPFPKPRILLAAFAAFCLAFSPLSDADAAMSGGRMGGSFSSSPAPVMRSAPRQSSYSPGYSRGYRQVYRPSVTVAPSVGYYGGGYNPFFNPFYSPFAGPRFFGGPGVISVSRGPSFFDVVFWGGLFFAVSQALSPKSTFDDFNSDASWGSVSAASPLGPGTSVVSLSVALQVPDRDDPNSILSALNRLSRTAKTDSRVGIQNLSSQVALEILRRRSSILSASTSTQHFSNRPKALQAFQKASVKERSKFETETVSKFGGVDYSSVASKLLGSNEESKGTMAVITLVLAIDGDSTKLNKIRNSSDVEQALQKIAADSKVGDCLQSAEILWTPEDRSETLSLRDVIADYPELRSI